MKTKSLIETNPYLKDPAKREELITRAVKTSGGVEGIKVTDPSKSSQIQIPRREGKKIYTFTAKRNAATK